MSRAPERTDGETTRFADRCPALREAASLIYPLDVWADPLEVWLSLLAAWGTPTERPSATGRAHDDASSRNVFWLDGGTSGISYLGTGELVRFDEVSTLDSLRGEVLLGERATAGRPTTAQPDGVQRVAAKSDGVYAAAAKPPGVRIDRRASLHSGEHPAEPVLGLIGWLGYDLRQETAGLSLHETSTEAAELPESGELPPRATSFIRVDRAITVDGSSGRIELLVASKRWSLELEHWALRLTESLRARREAVHSDGAREPSRIGEPTLEPGAEPTLEPGAEPTLEPGAEPTLEPANEPPPDFRPAVRFTDTDDELREKVRECQRLIALGEAYQLCLTTDAAVEGEVDVVSTYRVIRESSPSPQNAFIHIDGVTLMSASPERFLQLGADRSLRTQPIKGTRPRSADPGTDRRLAAELAADEKERAENVMIVDLMRNDFARVCEPHSVQVESLFEVQSFEHVHQLVSTVVGWLDPTRSSIDVIAACFPAGSMTGTPKIRATQLLERLEERERGPYAGAFGFIGANGTLDLAMTIRTVVADRNGARVGAGAGITALSRPDDEVDEIRLKARPLLDAIVLRP